MSKATSPPSLDQVADQIVESYHTDDRTQHLDATFLPNRDKAIELIELLRRLTFPGFFDRDQLTSDRIRDHVADLLGRARELMYDQVRAALRYDKNHADAGSGDVCGDCDTEADRVTHEVLSRIPEIRRVLATDVQAAFEGDPAAHSTDEAIFCYPGVDAVFIHRYAHELYRQDVPLLPRILSEYAHNATGIDIHPGAQIDDSFFIDHGTGVVIGETCVIGRRVKIYQGVTLGALSTKGGQAWRGRKRHPTIEDDVTIYGGAIILGGEVVIGEGCTIGGSVFITESIDAWHTVTMDGRELSVKPKRRKKPG